MPFVENEGVPLYYEVHGSGAPLFLHHGWSSYAGAWEANGYLAAFARHYRVILFDARGHGRSGKPHERASYSFRIRTDDVCAVLDAADVDRVNYLGYSMGGRVGYAMAQYHPERLHTLIVGGAAPKRPLDYEADKHPQTATMLREQGAYAVFKHRRPDADEAWLREKAAMTDAYALAADREAVLDWEGMDPSTIAVPTLVYAGSEDIFYPYAKEAAAQIPDCEFYELPGLVHTQASVSPEVPQMVIDWLTRRLSGGL